MVRSLLAALLFTGSLHAQNNNWSLSALNAPGGPTARFDAAMVHDPAGNQLLVFGGQSATGPESDLWSFSFASQSWKQLQPAGAVPPKRFGDTLVLDAARRRAILFGGQAGGFFSDVWAFEIETNQWTRLAADGAGPASRYGHSAVYDPRGKRMIVSTASPRRAALMIPGASISAATPGKT
jgi:hypothetical protein